MRWSGWEGEAPSDRGSGRTALSQWHLSWVRGRSGLAETGEEHSREQKVQRSWGWSRFGCSRSRQRLCAGVQWARRIGGARSLGLCDELEWVTSFSMTLKREVASQDLFFSNTMFSAVWRTDYREAGDSPIPTKPWSWLLVYFWSLSRRPQGQPSFLTNSGIGIGPDPKLKGSREPNWEKLEMTRSRRAKVDLLVPSNRLVAEHFTPLSACNWPEF